VTQQPGGSGPDLIGEFQRWLIKSSARGVGRQVTGQIRSALGRNQQQPTGDVWETATTEPPEEAPECAWCPLCRAARLLRETKPVRDTRVTAVSDALGTVVQDAFNVLEAALATTGRPASGAGAAKPSPGTKPAAAQPQSADGAAAAKPQSADGAAAVKPQSTDGAAAAQPRPAAQGPETEPAPESPNGAPREPDDRG